MITFSKDQLQISLAHNRLAILDLNESSNQPFTDSATGSCLVFNGEIYNYIELRDELVAAGYSFHTKSDTEVLLNAYLHWGTQAFSRFNGMFAFAIWDGKLKRLVLARDRFGVKPCYYVQRGQRFAFASNTTALAGFFNLDLNKQYLSNGVLSGLFENSDQSSPFLEMQALPPGHFLVLNGEPLRIERFYDLRARADEQRDQLTDQTEDQLVNELDQRLRSAVELRLRSDVPVTLSLSGGLDSALLASYMQELRPAGFEAFTYGQLDDSQSEASLAQQTARHLGVDLIFTSIHPKDLVSCFERTLDVQGAPFAHPSVIAQNRVFEKMNEHGYKVAIGGQGADEVFMGYRKFQFFNFQDLAKRHEFIDAASALWGLLLMFGADARNITSVLMYMMRYLRQPLGNEIFRGEALPGLDLNFEHFVTLRDRQLVDLDYASLLTLLRYEDRNSMGSSVESRMPFLDYRLVEFGLALPTQLKIRRGYGKWLMRQLSAKRLPAEIVYNRSKLAFSLSTENWLNKDGLANYLYQSISPKIGRLDGLLSDGCLTKLRTRAEYSAASNFPLLVMAHWLLTRTALA